MQPIPRYVKPKPSCKPALPLKRPDTLISSDYTLHRPFVPSYQRQLEKPDINNIMSMEYQRIWMNEKNEYLKQRPLGHLEEAKNIKNKLHAQLLADTAKRRAMKQPPPPEPCKAAKKLDNVRPRYKDPANRDKRPPAAAPIGRSGESGTDKKCPLTRRQPKIQQQQQRNAATRPKWH